MTNLARTPEHFKTDGGCVSETLIQDNISIINSCIPDTTSFCCFALSVSGDPVLNTRDHVGVEIALRTSRGCAVKPDFSQRSFM